MRRRLDVLCVELGLDHERTRDWCFVEAVLNACWSHDESAEKFEAKLAWADLIRTL